MCSRHVIGARDYVSISRPPKPPSWRDFPLPGTQTKKRGAKDVNFTDLSVLEKAKSDLGVGDASGQKHNKNKSNSRRYKKATVHRTRSETHLNSTDLPENHELTINLSKTKPQLFIREYGLSNEKAIKNAQIYLSQNAQKCKEWLEGVEASEPLEDVAFAQGSGVNVEIPEESWDEYVTEENGNIEESSEQSSLTQEIAKRQQGIKGPRVVVHRIMVHEYTEGLDNTHNDTDQPQT